jgi:hypothetical protein
MTAQIDELVLDNFKVSESDFRDMDSIVRRHCKTVKYYVYKGSTLGGYDTDDIDDLLGERNGIETRIVSVRLHATGPEALKFNVDFDDTVGINGECEDRARLVLLATEARAVIQDRMKVKAPKRKTILQVLAVMFFFLGYFGFQQYQNNYVNELRAEQAAQAGRLTAPYQRELAAAAPSNQKLLSQALNALSKQIISDRESQVTSPIYSAPPWWSGSYWLVIAVSGAAAAIAVGIGYITIPSSGSVFLIGDEQRRQEQSDKRREHIRWGILVALVVGVASGFISSLR